MCVCGGGCRHIDDGPATPQADPLSCVTRSQTLSVYTPDPSRHTTRPLPTLPPEPVTLAGEAWGQRLGVNLEVVVPDWLSDLTDCCRPDGRYDWRSEVKGVIKRSQLTFSSLAPSSAAFPHRTFDLNLRDYSASKSLNLNLTEVTPQKSIIISVPAWFRVRLPYEHSDDPCNEL